MYINTHTYTPEINRNLKIKAYTRGHGVGKKGNKKITRSRRSLLKTRHRTHSSFLATMSTAKADHAFFKKHRQLNSVPISISLSLLRPWQRLITWMYSARNENASSAASRNPRSACAFLMKSAASITEHTVLLMASTPRRIPKGELISPELSAG